MKKNLRYTIENGKLVWTNQKGGGERRVDAPCERMRRAKELALRVTREIHEAEKKEDAGKTRSDK